MSSVSTSQSPPPASTRSSKAKPRRKGTAERNKALIDKHKLYATDNVIDRINLGEWLLPTNKDFPNFIRNFNRETLSVDRAPIKLWNESDRKFNEIGAYSHQKFVSDFMNQNTPYTGILLYHGLGSGKSGASIMITEGFKNRQVVIMLPASLRNNYERELVTFTDIAYKKNYFWKFVDLSKVTVQKEPEFMKAFKEKGLVEELYNKIKQSNMNNLSKGFKQGIWMIDYTSEVPNFDSFSETEQLQIETQIKLMHSYRFTLLNYNSGAYTIPNILSNLVPQYARIKQELLGDKKKSQITNKDIDAILNHIYDSSNNIPNPFDNKILVIDEIHNLTSSMVGSGFNGPRIYELIMRATNLKLVLLSGTPVINYAFELGLMMNMLRGFIKSYTIKLKHPHQEFNLSTIDRVLSKIPSIDRYRIDPAKKSIDITRVPVGFIKSGTGTVIKSDVNTAVNDEHFIREVTEALRKLEYEQDGKYLENYFSMFPDLLVNKANVGSMLGSQHQIDASKELFNNYYIDLENLNLKNVETFKNRITGLVSFFNEISGTDSETGANIFPDLEFAEEDETHAEMSNFQFVEYAAKRKIERDLELIGKRKGGMNQKVMIESVTENVPNLFRVFSRQKGLFVFPPTIKRPMPPKKTDTVTDNILTSYTSEEVTEIKDSLNAILVGEKSEVTRKEELETYLGGLNADKEAIANELIGKLYSNDMSKYSSPLEWLKSYKFEDDTGLNIDESSSLDQPELQYRDILLEAIDKLTPDNLSPTGEGINLHHLSPKYALMLKNMNATPGLVFAYSQFRSVEGIEIFARILLNEGYSQLFSILKGGTVEIEVDTSISVGSMVRYELSDNNWRSFKVVSMNESETMVELEGYPDMVNISNVKRCVFALWTGTESVEQRSKILDIYSHVDNKYGQNCLMLFTTQSGAEGISLRFVRQVHIMEPYWNNVRIEQVIGRARRIKSHVLLPEDQRSVKVFQYIITLTDSQRDGSWLSKMSSADLNLIRQGKDSGFDMEDYTDETPEEEIIAAFSDYARKLSSEIETSDEGLSSDEVLAKISENKKILLDKFLESMKSAAIDCNFNKRANIRSNANLSNLECYDIITGEGDLSYDIWSADTARSSKSYTDDSKIKVVRTKKLTIPITYNGTMVKIFVNLPEELCDLSPLEALKSLDTGSKIYDYYVYHDIYYKEPQANFKSMYQIGTINNSGDKTNYVFTESFRSRISEYGKVQQCIKEIGAPPKTDSDIIDWADRIKTCHKEKDATTSINPSLVKWKCASCEEEITGPLCEDCNTSYAESSSRSVRSHETSREETRDTASTTKQSTEPCLLYTSPSPRDVEESRMPSSA